MLVTFKLSTSFMKKLIFKFEPTALLKVLTKSFVFLTILTTFSNNFSGISVNAQYGGIISTTINTTTNLKHSPGRYGNGLKLDDPYDCGGFKIYGYVEGGTKPYSVTLTLISSNRTLNRTAVFGNDRENWTSEVSYDTTNPNYIPTDTYTITSIARDANGSTATYTYSAFIRPSKDCKNDTTNTATNSSAITWNSASTKNSATTVITNGTNETPKTGEVVKVVQTQLLRTGAFAQSNPVVFSSSILLVALGLSLYLRRPKNIQR